MEAAGSLCFPTCVTTYKNMNYVDERIGEEASSQRGDTTARGNLCLLLFYVCLFKQGDPLKVSVLHAVYFAHCINKIGLVYKGWKLHL